MIINRMDYFHYEDTLPNLPHELIRHAIKDLERVEKLRIYRVEMGYWHSPTQRRILPNRCLVCLAGSVMAMSLGTPPDLRVSPGHFSPLITWKLLALNSFREGRVDIGLQTMNYKPVIFYRHITPYRDNPEAFKRDMLNLADDLEEAISRTKINQKITIEDTKELSYNINKQ